MSPALLASAGRALAIMDLSKNENPGVSARVSHPLALRPEWRLYAALLKLLLMLSLIGSTVSFATF